MKAPLVSVKMITYNHAPYIARAIEGVLRQRTDFPFELVIGEDCSTDGTREIVFDYQSRYPDTIRVITSNANVGMKANGYRTLKASRGTLIAFCEGDDYWHRTDKLQIQADYLEKHPECGLVYSSYDVLHVGSGRRIEDVVRCRNRSVPENPGLADLVQGKGMPLTCTVMLRKELYEEIIAGDAFLHKSDHFLMGDTQIWVELATKARLHYIPESFATYVITEESATRSRDVTRELKFSLSNAELFLYLCDKYKLPGTIRRTHEDRRDDYLLSLAFHTRDRKLADQVRNRKTAFTWHDWLRYYGTSNGPLHQALSFAARMRRQFQRTTALWT